MVQQVLQGHEVISAHPSHPSKVAHAILDIINSSDPEIRNPVGKDAESILKARDQLSDKELEQWARESYIEKKGFIR
jgi:hypothetical protein